MIFINCWDFDACTIFIVSWGQTASQLRHSFTSRLLHSCISSKLFDGEKTLRDLNISWAEQMASLFNDGLEVGAHMLTS